MKLIQNIVLIKQFIVVLISLSIYNCSHHNNINFNTGPDLIIESINIKVNSEDSNDRLGMPLRSRYNTLDITLRIKNIGTLPFNSLLYIASTSSIQDYQLNFFSGFELVEPSPTSILPDESIEVKLRKRVEQNSSNIKFQVNYHSDQSKISKETDYFNNTYLARY